MDQHAKGDSTSPASSGERAGANPKMKKHLSLWTIVIVDYVLV